MLIFRDMPGGQGNFCTICAKIGFLTWKSKLHELRGAPEQQPIVLVLELVLVLGRW